MAQLGLSIIGAGAGAVVGENFFDKGTLGSQIGFLGGAILGGLLFPTNTTSVGPRRTDLDIQVSTYGKVIPICYGTVRITGNVIWSTGIIEEENKVKSGKGGPSQTQISYRYKTSLAIAFCEREADRLIKLFIDGKLFVNTKSTSTTPESENINNKVNYRFYTGSEDQEPDPLIESVEGVGNVPAYRGICYMVIEDLYLENFGNRIPQFEVLITFNGSNNYPYKIIESGENVRYHDTNLIIDRNRPFIYAVPQTAFSSQIFTKINIETNEVEEIEDKSDIIRKCMLQTTGVVDEDGYIWMQTVPSSGTLNNCPIYQYEPNKFNIVNTCGYQAIFGGWERIGAFAILFPIYVPIGMSGQLEKCMIAISRRVASGICLFSRERIYFNKDNLRKLVFYGEAEGVASGLAGSIVGGAVDKNNGVWTISGIVSGSARLNKYEFFMTNNPEQFTTKPGSEHQAEFFGRQVLDLYFEGELEYGINMTYFEDDHSLLIIGKHYTENHLRLIKFDIETESVINSLNITNMTSANHEDAEYVNDPIQDGLLMIGSGTRGNLINVSSLEIVNTYNWSDWDISGTNGRVFHKDSMSVFTGKNEQNGTVNRMYLNRFSGAGEPLKTVVDDICQRNDLTIATDVESSTLTGTVNSYSIGSNVKGNASLRPLFEVFNFRGYPNDWKIEYTHLDKSVSFAIPEGELGSKSIESGIKNEIDVEEKFLQEQELPLVVNLIHPDPARDYQVSTSYASRPIEATDTRENITLETPIALTINQGKQLVERELYRLWVERSGLSTTLPYKRLRLNPSDVGTITVDNKIYTVRILSIDYDTSMTVAIQTVQSDEEVYNTYSEGYSGESIEQEVIQLPSQSDVFIFDIPLLRDIDATNGQGPTIYLSSVGYNPDNWLGAVVFKSFDNTQYYDIRTLTNIPTYGVLTTSLSRQPNWGSWDKLRNFEVQLRNGSLSSATDSEVLTSFKNAALVQSGNHWELLQFRDVTSLGDKKYKCETLIRGIKGTDNFQDHVEGDMFFLLDEDAIKRYIGENEDINQNIYYKSVSIGRPLEKTPYKLKLLEGNSYKPWTVSDVRGSRDGSNNLDVTFKRRTRFGGPLIDFIDTVALNEETESYEIDVLDDSEEVLRTIESTSQSFSYTAAEQTTDGLTPGDEIDFIIYQLSAIVGRGFGLEVKL